MVVDGHRAWLVALVATAIGVVAARETVSRWTLAFLGVILALGVPWILAPALSGLIWSLSAPKRSLVRWLPRRLTTRAFLLVLAIGLAASAVAAAVSLLQLSADPIQFDLVAPAPVLLWVAIVVLAAANAFGEEALWRGLLVDETRGGAPLLIGMVQFVSFGAAHWYGLPAGPWGAMLAGGFSCVLYWLSERKGMLASTTAHMITDIVIFAAIAPTILYTGWYSAPS
ncbi:CPBP family intramembrane glutamic endopeptidase [Microbacterium sp. E-13]|uniref:CPBP family intramembrane glutamic endopeptidase n=1 Tax=Microbacterium sp. E-13 TaxID=3404048 RepID=UPI003CED40C7